jgi:hypothetical protein
VWKRWPGAIKQYKKVVHPKVEYRIQTKREKGEKLIKVEKPKVRIHVMHINADIIDGPQNMYKNFLYKTSNLWRPVSSKKNLVKLLGCACG